ncbi:pentatricopeptide repeat-containing protein At4g02750 [Cryptomeria japonica]|uniref:pentatricopeptide repeat-containing protein At4g02750 n=1 Tax=Cryptomeria japonica TaxID=3369 RepID=UPI0027DA7996|nr:pentatricopeptide repeat-containing protein At4g02750 [Cryptomeria japonica]
MAAFQKHANANTFGSSYSHVESLCEQSSTYVRALQECIRKKSLGEGRQIHACISKKLIAGNIILQNTLISMYVKCGSLVDARRVFDEIAKKDVCSWTVMIAAYARHGVPQQALSVFYQMQQNAGVKPNNLTYSAVLSACNNLEFLNQGMKIHQQIIKCGLASNVFVASALVDKYAKCGKIDNARQLFDKMGQRDLVSWNAMVSGYAQNGLMCEALMLFKEMPEKNVISWNSLVAGYARNGAVDTALKLFDEMPQRNVVSWNAMISGLSQNGLIDEALELFKRMPQRTVVSWNAIISGLAQNGRGEESLQCFQEMKEIGMRADFHTYGSILPVCGNMAALELGVEIHEEIVRQGFESNVVVMTGLVDMYAQCGSLGKARQTFDKMHQRDVVAWNAMIAGYAMHGCAEEAFQLFEQMKSSGMSPNHITFICVLSACVHAGLVDEGYQYFNSMCRHYHIEPKADHYTCMVDLLGRAGRLEEAIHFINRIPTKPDAVIWSCLLGACRIHKNLEIAEWAAEHLFELNPTDPAPYVLLSNIYASAGRWDDIGKVRQVMKEKGIKKTPGCSWIEVGKKIHGFLVGDKSHPQTREIYLELERLNSEMKMAGYVPDTSFVLSDVKEEEKEQVLFHHSERLAIAFGLLNTFPGSTIRIVKNLRICGDCHSAIKFISMIVEREIIVRDTYRYHHFKNGQCSCGNFW